jgi:hypothetical protein
MKMTVHIMIAAPGAGKSKLAKELIKEGGTIVSADSYFESWNRETSKDEYNFDVTKLGEAHASCLRRFTSILVDMDNGRTDCENLVVDNTNSSLVEIAPYYALARAYGHKGSKALEGKPDIVFHRFLANRHELEHVYFPRNVHGVPLHAVMAIGKRVWELEFPPFWEFELVDHNMTRSGERVHPEPEPSIFKG